MRKFIIVAALLGIFIAITTYTFLGVYEHTTGWVALGVAITGLLPLLLLLSLVLQFHDMKSRLENKEKLPQHERDYPSRLPTSALNK